MADLKNSYLMVGHYEWPIEIVFPPHVAKDGDGDGNPEIHWDVCGTPLALDIHGARAVARRLLECALELEAMIETNDTQQSLNLSTRNEQG